MSDAALLTIQTRIKETLERIQTGEPPAALFAGVYVQGDVVDATTLPVAAIVFGEDDALETTAKTKLTLPFDVMVNFEVGADAAPRDVHADLLAKIQAALHANRNLGDNAAAPAAIDLRYVGGGCKLEPLTDENPCALWGFIAEFEVDFRYVTADPAVIA